jgi:hypothetical protein
MHAIDRMLASCRPMQLFRAFAAIVLTVTASLVPLAAPAVAAEQSQSRLRLTPEQRRDMLERMTPQQREQWRNARSPEDRQRTFQQLSPEQRREMWQQLSPEQRELMLRRLTPEQRQGIRGQMSREERQAMRERFIDQTPGALPRGEQWTPRHQLSPEERQRLRQQIEAQRDVYRRGNSGNKGASK